MLWLRRCDAGRLLGKSCSNTSGNLHFFLFKDLDQVFERTFNEVLALALRYQLTSYDAAYLELAHRRGFPLAASDGNLLQAARAIKVAIFNP